MLRSHEISGGDLSDDLHVDPSSPIPLYVQLREALRARASELGAGGRMPSETQIAAATGVSRITVRRSMSDLTHEGVLETSRGRGTLVAQVRAEEAVQVPDGFTHVMRQLGFEPSSILLSASTSLPTAAVAETLELASDELVFVVERVRLMSGEPCMLERAHLPAKLVPGLLDEDLTGSMYELLDERYSLRIASGTERIGATTADRRSADALRVKPKSPLLLTVRTTRSDQNVPIEHTERLARPDLLAFRVRLEAGSSLGAGEAASSLASLTSGARS